jgi:hypothetical protein
VKSESRSEILTAISVSGFYAVLAVAGVYSWVVAGALIGCVSVLYALLLARRRHQALQLRRRILVPPQKQLMELSGQYGLFVTTPLRKSEPLPDLVIGKPRVCNGKWHAEERFCPRHGSRALAEPEAEAPYRPEGTDELQADLLEYLYAQVADAAEADGATLAGKRHWEMNAEWAAEVKKLPKAPGYASRNTRLWQPRTRVMPPGYPTEYLLKYPVRVGDAFGAPHLEVS